MKKIIFLFLAIGLLVSCKDNPQTKTPVTQKKTVEKVSKDCTKEVAFGDTTLCLPNVSGWVECYDNVNVKQRFDPYDTSDNMTLAYYLSEKTYKQVDNLTGLTFDDYFKVYAPNQGKNKDMTASEMKQIVNMMSGSFISKTMEETNKELQQKGKDISMTQPILIDRYQPQANASSVIILMNIGMGEESMIMAMEMTATVVKKRLVFMAYYLHYNDEKTIKELKKNSDLFVGKFLQNNK